MLSVQIQSLHIVGDHFDLFIILCSQLILSLFLLPHRLLSQFRLIAALFVPLIVLQLFELLSTLFECFCVLISWLYVLLLLFHHQHHLQLLCL